MLSVSPHLHHSLGGCRSMKLAFSLPQFWKLRTHHIFKPYPYRACPLPVKPWGSSQEIPKLPSRSGVRKPWANQACKFKCDLQAECGFHIYLRFFIFLNGWKKRVFYKMWKLYEIQILVSINKGLGRQPWVTHFWRTSWLIFSMQGGAE